MSSKKYLTSGYLVSEDVSLPFLGRMFELLVIVVDDLKIYGSVLLHGGKQGSQQDKHMKLFIE